MDSVSQNRAPNFTSNLVEEFNRKIRKSDSKRGSNLLRLKFSEPTLLCSWKKLAKNVFLERIKQQTNIGDLFKLLFTISGDLQWRQWSHHMQVIIQEIHNKLIKSGDYERYTAINQFQIKLERLFCMKDKHISAHLTLLIEMLLTVNKYEGFLNQSSLSISLIDLTGEAEINTKIMWMLSTMESVDPQCIGRLLKKELFKSNQLPFLTIVSNFITYCAQHNILELLGNQTFTSLITQIFRCQFTDYKIRRQAHLLLNNILGRKGQGFCKIIGNQQLMEILLREKSEETWWTILILTQVSRETGNVYISEENKGALIHELKVAGWGNTMIEERLGINEG